MSLAAISNERLRPVLRLEHIRKEFGGIVALDDVTLDVQAGEVLALVGDNGAGKSTLVKIIVGVHPPTGGRMLIDGMLSHAVPSQPLRQMGADRVLAVHLKGKWADKDGPRHLFDVIGQCFAIAQEMNSAQWKQATDLLIEPDVNGYKYDAFEHSAALVRAGEIATRGLGMSASAQIRSMIACSSGACCGVTSRARAVFSAILSDQ